MNLNSLLEISISLVFVYMLLSIIVSSINELIVYILNSRGKFLKNAIDEVFNDTKNNKNYTDLLYKHPGIDRLKKVATQLPSYISSKSFSTTLSDMVANEYTMANTKFVQDPSTLKITEVNSVENMSVYDRFKKGVDDMNHSDVKVLLGTFLNGTENFQALQTNIETWYNDYMDRVAGWYKTNLQKWLFVVAIGVTISLNVDTVMLVQYISKDEIVRIELVKGAEAYLQNAQNTSKNAVLSSDSLTKHLNNINKAVQDLEAYKLPIGWDCSSANFNSWTIVGWILTAFAISFGAPFWFQVLNKFINLRKTGIKPESTKSKTVSNV